MIRLIGRKLGMTRVFLPERGAVPVTVVRAEPATVLRAKTPESDGYAAIVAGAAPVSKPGRMKSAQKGEFKKCGTPYFRIVREYRTEGVAQAPAPGAVIDATLFKAGDRVDVSGVTKGRGFQGPVRRYGFAGGRATHGSGFHRSHGSTGMHTDPAKVIKGKRMAGHMGAVNRTVLNLEVVQVRPEDNLILIRGAVPGHPNGWVSVRRAVKKAGQRA